jgi:hypothetical protein
MQDGYTITNRYTVPNDKISLTVTKQWVDSNNQYNKRPQSIVLLVKKDNVIVMRQIVKAVDNWSYTFTGLAKYNKAGEEAVYTVDEEPANAGELEYYDKAIVGNTITNTFKVTNDSVTSSIIKKADKEEISAQDEPITYNINYSATVKEYIGSATITITDTLPYEIDTTKSDLNGGTYNPDNKTIKWTENVENINTFTANQAKQIAIQKQLKLIYTNYDIQNGTGKIDNTVVGKIVLNTTGKTDEKQDTEEVLINTALGKIVVNHYLKGTTEELAPSSTQEGKVGTPYETQANADLLKEYDLVAEPENKKGSFTRADQTINYYYVKKQGNLVVEYVEKSTNEKLLDDKKSTEDIGTQYKTNEENIKYYKFIESTGNTSGQYKLADQTVIYYYQKLTFNLAVNKELTSYVLNGTERPNVKELAKLELDKKAISKTELKLKYKITVKNTGELAGSTDLFEEIPQGFIMEESSQPRPPITLTPSIRIASLTPMRRRAP